MACSAKNFERSYGVGTKRFPRPTPRSRIFSGITRFGRISGNRVESPNELLHLFGKTKARETIGSAPPLIDKSKRNSPQTCCGLLKSLKETLVVIADLEAFVDSHPRTVAALP